MEVIRALAMGDPAHEALATRLADIVDPPVAHPWPRPR
jgi:hypothetical protein